MAKSVSKPKAKRKPTDPTVLAQRRFARSIRTMFTNMGFTHLPTEGREAKFGIKAGELDSTFIYDNVILIVEDTTSTKPFEHAKNKKLLAEQILGSKSAFVGWLKAEFPGESELLGKYASSRYKIFFLYISQIEMNLDDDSLQLLLPMKVVTARALSYFEKLAKTIRKSARTDLWRFLELNSKDIGPVDASGSAKTIETAIISPDDSTGFTNGVRLVSFMISADVLLRNSYVLRKDNWGYSTELYQRLIDSGRINKIRKYVASQGSAFLNNIIVGLPQETSFQDANKQVLPLADAQDYSAYRMTIPDEFNSICIIDGQHRVFAHFEGNDDLESTVASVRSKVHLLATGLVFPPTMTELDRLKLQSEIFLAINSNTKPVPADVLLAIQSLQAPYADVAIARRVLEQLNKKSAFRGLLQLTQMDEAPIRIASIVKFALRYLVDLDSDGGLFTEWSKLSKENLTLREKANPDLLTSYVNYCARILDVYFNAFRSHHAAEWADPNSKIISTTVINAMIIALRRSLPALHVLDFKGYSNLMKSWKVDFSKTNFSYASSQYARFSRVVLEEMFQLVEEDGDWTLKT